MKIQRINGTKGNQNSAIVHCKKKWIIINPHSSFMTVRSVYEHNLPFYKSLLLLEVGTGLCPVASSYTLVLVSLFINSFCVDERNQTVDTEFIITCNQCAT